MKGFMPSEGINPVELPEECNEVWRWFMTLNGKRQPGMSGPSPISESEIGWFFHNRHITPKGWEIDAIDQLDRVALADDPMKA